MTKIDLLHGDCLELMKDIPDESVDMILADLPYGTTACKWDTIIPFEPLWEQYERVIKDNGAIVLTASQPFTSALVMSNPKLFRHEWIWDKMKGSGSMLAKVMPIKAHESILVFGKKRVTYTPIMVKAQPKNIKRRENERGGRVQSEIYGELSGLKENRETGLRYPKTIISISSQAKELNQGRRLHPTQKPVELMEYLIKTYTNEGETVLDNTMGSGSTGVACVNTKRNFIGIELDDKYFEIAKQRIREALNKPEQITMW